MERTSSRDRAFTMVELLVVIGIIIMLTLVALPATLGIMKGRQIKDGARMVQTAILRARQKAISLRRPVVVFFNYNAQLITVVDSVSDVDSDGDYLEGSGAIIAFDETDFTDGDEKVIYETPLPEKVEFAKGRSGGSEVDHYPYLVFSGDGSCQILRTDTRLPASDVTSAAFNTAPGNDCDLVIYDPNGSEGYFNFVIATGRVSIKIYKAN